MPLSNVQYQITPLTDIAQGDDATQRNGRSVLIKSLYLSRICLNDVTALSSPPELTMISDIVGTAPSHVLSLDIDFKDEIYFPIYKNFYRSHVKYIGTTANVADLGPGTIFLAAISTNQHNTSPGS